MATVRWLPQAIADVERLHQFLYQKDEVAAARAAACILETARLLQDAPRVGKPMPDESKRREIFAAFGAGAYVIRYHLVDHTSVVIIRVWHSRETR